ncbi:ClpP/crotonase [Testicularia cyperi]|uniref:ClpP/crotonase n=1 Tax=Testicularia cyperi TaxID=1882483 RepID=A0A317XMJ7_9BASI|nr:ClpP/crotonase [Testicularia cyperi]
MLALRATGLAGGRMCRPGSCSMTASAAGSTTLALRLLRSYSIAAGAGSGELVTLSPLSSLQSEVGSTSKYDNHISVLTLNRPAAKNAISRALLAELDAHVSGLATGSSSVRALLVRSSVPGTFCAGADLKERKGMSKPEVDAFLLGLRKAFTQISKLPMPTIACLDGLAMGGGLELALTCDLRIAGPAATKLGLTETKLGIIPGAGGTTRMTRLVGLAKTKELIFSAKLVDGPEASRIGFVDIVAERGYGQQGQEAFHKAVELGRAFAKNGPLAVRAAKLAIDRGSQMDPETALDFERQCYETILNTQDRLEGLKAFAEKREPVYRGDINAGRESVCALFPVTERAEQARHVPPPPPPAMDLGWMQIPCKDRWTGWLAETASGTKPNHQLLATKTRPRVKDQEEERGKSCVDLNLSCICAALRSPDSV